jgi:hypothetical protein
MMLAIMALGSGIARRTMRYGRHAAIVLVEAEELGLDARLPGAQLEGTKPDEVSGEVREVGQTLLVGPIGLFQQVPRQRRQPGRLVGLRIDS